MFKEIIDYAMEKFAGDEKQIGEFLEGFIKEASDGAPKNLFERVMSYETSPARVSNQGETLAHSLRKGFSGALGKGFGDLAIALGATGVGTAYRAISQNTLHSKFLQALERAVQTNQILKQAKKERVLQYAETVFKFAPNVATDPNLLSSILANAIHGEGIDPMTIKTLTELEGRYRDNAVFTPKTYV